MYDSILKNTISTCMTRDDDVTVVANILIEDFIASSTSVILVHYSSSISMITLDYKVKSDFIDSSYTMLSSNLILSVTQMVTLMLYYDDLEIILHCMNVLQILLLQLIYYKQRMKVIPMIRPDYQIVR